jgi:hypothetical protein
MGIKRQKAVRDFRIQSCDKTGYAFHLSFIDVSGDK